MNLSPLYELRDRLKGSAIAGTSLLVQDFRLTRAQEAFVPLEAAAPVFARLGQSVRTLTAADCPDPAAALLDTLALCDAILTTQAKVSVDEIPEPICPPIHFMPHSNAPYGIVHPLLVALTTSGGGHYSFVLETHQQSPHLFSDYRIKYAMIQALGAAYVDLAQLVMGWLCEEGPELIPLLKTGFDPKGKKEMVRRVQVIEHIAKADENDFYLSLLQSADKEIKAAAVYALRHDTQNIQTLITSAKTEKGLVKKMAHWALADLDCPLSWDYWNELSQTHPEQMAEYMIISTTAQASALIGTALCSLLHSISESKSTCAPDLMTQLQALMYAVPCKSGPEITAFFIKGAALGTVLDKPLPEQKKPYQFNWNHGYYETTSQSFSALLPLLLFRCLVFDPKPEFVALSQSLHQTYGALYALPAIVAALLTTETGYEEAKTVLKRPKFQLPGSKKQYKDAVDTLIWALGFLHQEKSTGAQSFKLSFHNPVLEEYDTISTPLAAPLPVQYYDDMIEYGGKFDEFLRRGIWPDDHALKQKLGQYFYERSLQISDHYEYLEPLKSLGWTNFTGMLTCYCKSQRRLDHWRVRQYLQMLPTTNAEKAAELEAFLNAIDPEDVKFTKGQTATMFHNMILQLRS